ncbi:MAG: HD domain-containing protein [Candidatus Scalindua sp.]|nr:HD domain-containing protein [Candidatus Scalindua sp.]
MEELLQFLFEVGHLKNVQRSGWCLIGNRAPESVAEHSFRCAVLGYFLAQAENIDTHKVVLMCLFHDVHESRISDLHKVAQRYINVKECQEEVSQDQIKSLKNPQRDEIGDLLKEFSNQETRESKVAKDADSLECVLQAREYQVQEGRKDAEDWIRNAHGTMKSDSAKKLMALIENSDPNEWWKKLKEK